MARTSEKRRLTNAQYRQRQIEKHGLAAVLAKEAATVARCRQRQIERIGIDQSKALVNRQAKTYRKKHRSRILARERTSRDHKGAISKRLNRNSLVWQSKNHGDGSIREIGKNELQNDRTRWIGPGMYRARELEEQANRILKAHEPAKTKATRSPTTADPESR